MCVASGKPFHIPLEISVACVRSAEEIVNSSYSHSEVFTSVCQSEIFGVLTQILTRKPVGFMQSCFFWFCLFI